MAAPTANGRLCLATRRMSSGRLRKCADAASGPITQVFAKALQNKRVHRPSLQSACAFSRAFSPHEQHRTSRFTVAWCGWCSRLSLRDTPSSPVCIDYWVIGKDLLSVGRQPPLVQFLTLRRICLTGFTAAGRTLPMYFIARDDGAQCSPEPRAIKGRKGMARRLSLFQRPGDAGIPPGYPPTAPQPIKRITVLPLARLAGDRSTMHKAAWARVEHSEAISGAEFERSTSRNVVKSSAARAARFGFRGHRCVAHVQLAVAQMTRRSEILGVSNTR